MKKPIFVENNGNLINFKYEDNELIFSCTQIHWKLKNKIYGMVTKYNIPEEEVDELLGLYRETYDENRSYDEDY